MLLLVLEVQRGGSERRPWRSPAEPALLWVELERGTVWSIWNMGARRCLGVSVPATQICHLLFSLLETVSIAIWGLLSFSCSVSCALFFLGNGCLVAGASHELDSSCSTSRARLPIPGANAASTPRGLDLSTASAPAPLKHSLDPLRRSGPTADHLYTLFVACLYISCHTQFVFF